jgi:hypothetical protein
MRARDNRPVRLDTHRGGTDRMLGDQDSRLEEEGAQDPGNASLDQSTNGERKRPSLAGLP